MSAIMFYFLYTYFKLKQTNKLYLADYLLEDTGKYILLQARKCKTSRMVKANFGTNH
jgi:hypothetical protein